LHASIFSILFFTFIMVFPSPTMKILEQLHKITLWLLLSTPFQFTTQVIVPHSCIYSDILT
jgi:uncharacterized membrane protein